MAEELQERQEERRGGKLFDVPKYPLSRTIGFGATTLVGMGLIDVAAHLGPTGLVVGLIATYVVGKHGPEVLESLTDKLPEVSAKRPVLQPPSSAEKKKGSRTVIDRALGRFPDKVSEEEEVAEVFDADMEEEQIEAVDVELERPTVVDPEVQPALHAAPFYRARHAEREILLSPRLGLDIDEVIEAGVFVAGMKGSGKSSLAARLMEQTGRFPLSQIIYDLKGDFTSLIPSHFQNGLVMSQNQQYDAETIHQCRLQVVVDLSTWDSMEERAQVIAELNQSLLKYAMRLSEDARVPWFVHLDEAQQFASQQKPVGIEAQTWKAVTQSVMNLGVLGRAFGAVPCLYTQRIADIHKDVISQQELRIFMKAALDNDLSRYEEYINKTVKREDIQAFRAGDAVVILPDGRQLIVHFSDRESKHGSHTPHLTQALRLQQEQRYAPLPVARERVPSAEHMPVRVAPMREQIVVPSITVARSYAHPTSQLSPELQRALSAWQSGANSVRKLMRVLDIPTYYQANQLYQQMKAKRLID